LSGGESRLRVGVVGVGYFGRFHALKFARHPRARLVGLADPDPARVVEVAAECGTEAYCDPGALLGAVDAVSIAAPAGLHAPLAEAFLEAGAHVLVEKPLAASLVEADRLIALAKAKDLVLQVGHQERAVLAAGGLFDVPERPRAIHCVRKGPFTGRNIDVDVVLDLMTHDLDMVHALNPSPLRDVEAKGRVLRSALLDEVEARLTLADGATARIEASRVAEARARTMTLDYASGRIAIDFLARTVENTTPYALRDIFPAGEDQTGVVGDPLGFALDRFLAAARGEAPPLVSGAEARFALAAAERIRSAIAEH
jgi:predicted dehydrogenase